MLGPGRPASTPQAASIGSVSTCNPQSQLGHVYGLSSDFTIVDRISIILPSTWAAGSVKSCNYYPQPFPTEKLTETPMRSTKLFHHWKHTFAKPYTIETHVYIPIPDSYPTALINLLRD